MKVLAIDKVPGLLFNMIEDIVMQVVLCSIITKCHASLREIYLLVQQRHDYE